MTKPIFFDFETCGLYGVPVLLQYAFGDGPIELVDLWYLTPHQVSTLFERIANHKDGIVGFNVAFDWFHLYKFWTMMQLMKKKDIVLIDQIQEVFQVEQDARDYPYCLKPVKVHDVMLHARKTEYQSTMDRADIRIRKVPTPLAQELADELENRLHIKDIYFARAKEKKTRRWQVYDRELSDGDIDPEFKDIVLVFNPSAALKVLAVDALKIPPEQVLLFKDIEVDPKLYPEECGYAPFAKALGASPRDWKGTWPSRIKEHIYHWATDDRAREYASNDITYTRALYNYFGSPPLGDDDSELTCCVACVRWRGFAIDIPGINKLRDLAKLKSYMDVDGERVKIPTAPEAVRKYVLELMSETEKLMLRTQKKVDLEESTAKMSLEAVSKMKIDCESCKGKKKIEGRKCKHCKGTGEDIHPAAARAKQILDARACMKEVELYDKLLRAGRFHASFNVIGTLSGRMSGTDELNAQGIKKSKDVRCKFPLAMGGFILCGGDFSSFEVTLADACYNDPQLRKDLQSYRPCYKCKVDEQATGKCYNCNGKGCDKCKDTGTCDECHGRKVILTTIHALFGTAVYPDMTYDDIMWTKGLGEDDRYTRAKSAVFAMFYGGEGYTLKTKLGVDEETANEAYKTFCRMYPKVGTERQKVLDMFCSMRQPRGIGTQVEWHEPARYIEAMFGFRRYFDLENMICKELYGLASQPPRKWQSLRLRVVRRDREQTVGGAVQSALYAAAFQIQSGCQRAASNHVIQSGGATATKRVQRAIWDLQPSGKADWQVQPMNIHDEIMCPCKPGIAHEVESTVNRTVESFRDKVPLIKMDWKIGLESWASK